MSLKRKQSQQTVTQTTTFRSTLHLVFGRIRWRVAWDRETVLQETSRQPLLGWRCARSHSHIPVLAICLHNRGEIIMGRYIIRDTRMVRWEIHYVTPGWRHAGYCHGSPCSLSDVTSEGWCIMHMIHVHTVKMCTQNKDAGMLNGRPESSFHYYRV